MLAPQPLLNAALGVEVLLLHAAPLRQRIAQAGGQGVVPLDLAQARVPFLGDFQVERRVVAMFDEKGAA